MAKYASFWIIRDFAAAVQTLASAEQWAFSVYNATSAHPVSVRRLAGCVQAIYGGAELSAAPIGRKEPGSLVLSMDRMRDEHDWRAAIPIENSLEYLREFWAGLTPKVHAN